MSRRHLTLVWPVVPLAILVSSATKAQQLQSTAEIVYGDSYTFETPTSSLKISGQGTLHFTSDTAKGISFGFRDPRFAVDYTLEGVDSKLSINLFQNWDTLLYADTASLPSEATGTEDGMLVQTGGKLVYAFGDAAPIGAALELNYKRSDYLNTTAAGLINNQSWGGTLSTRASLTPTTEARLSLGYSFLTLDDAAQTERSTRSVSLGISQDLTPLWSLDGSLGYTNIFTDQTALATTATSYGFTGALGVSRELQDGRLTARMTRSQDVNGAVNTFRFGRDMELPRGTLSGSIGTDWRDGGQFMYSGEVNYTEQFRDGTLSINLARNLSLNADNADVVTTKVGIDYSLELTQFDNFGLSFDWTRNVDGGGGSVVTSDYKTLGASYTHELTESWNLETGARTRLSDDVNGTRSDNWLFVRLAHKF